MSFKVELIDEYSSGAWFSHHLRFATEAEATECSVHHLPYAGWSGILDVRVVLSDDPVNARCTEKSLFDKDGEPIKRTYQPPQKPEDVQAEARRLGAMVEATARRIAAKTATWENGTQRSLTAEEKAELRKLQK